MASKFKNRIFITGMLRTGTTLLDKLLHAHPLVAVASQPLFRLFVYVKERYHREHQVESLPLSPHFCEPLHLRQNFGRYLEGLTLNESDLAHLRKEIAEANNRWSPAFTSERLESLKPGNFFQLLEQAMRIVGQIYGTEQTRIIGLKEVLCEEFLPVLMGKGYRGIIVCRDPRAVVSSVSTGKHETYVGKVRPALLNIRNWRKSVAYAISLRANPDFCLVKYEDLVLEPLETLERVTDFLGVEPFGQDFGFQQIKSQNGSAWRGNSSYGEIEGISKDSLFRWNGRLSAGEISLIEYCCCAEMAYLGYDPVSNPFATRVEELEEFRPVKRPGYAVEHRLDDRNISKEKERFAYLAGYARPGDKAVYDYFFSPDVWQILSLHFERCSSPDVS